MPRIAIDYTKTIIYKIVCKDISITDIYVGHTTNFTNRKNGHKSNSINLTNIRLYEMINANGGWENWEMIPIETYSCNNRIEALIRERYHIDILYPTLNMVRSILLEGESKELNKAYRQDNKEKLKEQKKEYYENNKVEFSEKAKELYINNKEDILEKHKEYYDLNRDELVRKKKIYNEKNKEGAKIKQKIYYETVKEKHKEKVKCICCDIFIRKKNIIVHNKTNKHLKNDIQPDISNKSLIIL